MRKIVLLVCILVSSFCGTVFAGITNYPALNQADFWLKNYPAGDELILDENQIEEFNQAITAKSPTVYNLASYPLTVSGERVKTLIEEFAWLFEENLYVKGTPLSDNYKQLIVEEMNINSVPAEVNIQYAVTTSRVNLRAMPTNEGWFYSAADTHFDQLQHTALDPGEPVVVLHKSKSGNFVLVRSYNYAGWLPVWTLGLASREAWLEYVDPANFLVVATNKITLKIGGRENIFQMGAKIPVRDLTDTTYTVLFPSRNQAGNLVAQLATLPNDDSKYVLGYLPYTRHNIIEQAFKFIQDPYGWGGLNDSVDCSAFIANIYRSVGIYLPRDADEQEETAGLQLILENLDTEQRNSLFAAVKPGDVLFMPGHTMLYLGQNQGKHYIIHALGSHYTNGQRERVMKVVVSDLELKVSSGRNYFDVLTSVLSYK